MPGRLPLCRSSICDVLLWLHRAGCVQRASSICTIKSQRFQQVARPYSHPPAFTQLRPSSTNSGDKTAKKKSSRSRAPKRTNDVSNAQDKQALVVRNVRSRNPSKNTNGFRMRRSSRQLRQKGRSRSVSVRRCMSRNGVDAASRRRQRNTIDLTKVSDATVSRNSAATWLRQRMMAAEKSSQKNGVDDISSFDASALKLDVLDTEVNPAPRLAFGLDRVLFNPGVYQLQDSHSRVYNFDPWLQNIPDIKTFDFRTLNPFTPPSRDLKLLQLAEDQKKKYFGSTSSMTGMLKHFHFLLSNFRPLDTSQISRSTSIPKADLTKITQGPDAIFLRKTDPGVFAIDADKLYDNPNVLSLMGTYMETFFTNSESDFKRHLHNSTDPIKDDEKPGHDSFHYSSLGDMVMRSQLDAHDPRLPGAGIFDLKTRAVLPIRMSSADYEWATAYELYLQHGDYFSYEREFLDMCRSTLLKYSLQVRMGRMDGIFVAYHNICRVFGFEYLPLSKLDKVLHGQEDTILGDWEFLASLKLVNEVLNRATAQFPKESLRIHFDTITWKTCMHIFVEPVTEDEIQAIQSTNKDEIAKFEAAVLGVKDMKDMTPVKPAPPQQKAEGKSNRSKDLNNSSASSRQSPKVDRDSPSPGQAMQSTAEPEQNGDSTTTLQHAWQNINAFFGVLGGSTKDHLGVTGASISPEAILEQKENDLGFETDDLDRLRVVTRDSAPESSDEQPAKPTKPTKPAKPTKQYERPERLLGIKLFAASTVNGKLVDRPKNINKRDVWAVNHHMEIMDDETAHALYQKTQQRRHAALSQEDRNFNDFYMKMLRDKAQQAGRRREELTILDEITGRDKVKRMWNDEISLAPEIEQQGGDLLTPAKLNIIGRDILHQSHLSMNQASTIVSNIESRLAHLCSG